MFNYTIAGLVILPVNVVIIYYGVSIKILMEINQPTKNALNTVFWDLGITCCLSLTFVIPDCYSMHPVH